MAFSEALHFCQAGYPLTDPKKACVGGWWGQTVNGQVGGTDGLLSEATGWRLIAVQDDAEVLSGSLTLAKPASQRPELQRVRYLRSRFHGA